MQCLKNKETIWHILSNYILDLIGDIQFKLFFFKSLVKDETTTVLQFLYRITLTKVYIHKTSTAKITNQIYYQILLISKSNLNLKIQ